MSQTRSRGKKRSILREANARAYNSETSLFCYIYTNTYMVKEFFYVLRALCAIDRYRYINSMILSMRAVSYMHSGCCVSFFFALCILFTLLIHIRGCARVRFCMRILYASYMYECDELKLIIHVLSSSSRNKCTHMWCVKKWNERARAYRKLQRCASSVVLNETERLFMAFYIHVVYVQQLLIYFKFTSSCMCVCVLCLHW